MIKIFILLIVFIGFVGTTLVTSTLYFSQLISNLNTQTDLSNISSIKNVLKNNLIYNGNKIIAPYGVNGSNYHELPNWITFERYNVYGYPYIYCPYATESVITSNNTVLNTDSTNYQVETVNNGRTNNKDYVSASIVAPFNNIIGIIISPKNPNNLTNCDSVTYSEGYFRSDSGFVEVIDSESILLSDLNKIETVSLSIANNGQYGLSNELQSWSGNQPTKAVYRLKTNETFLFNTSNQYINEEADKKDIYIKGESNVVYSRLQGSGVQELTFDNVNINIENIIVSGSLKLNFINSNVTVRNSLLSNIELNNSKIIFDDSEINNLSNNFGYSIESYNSEIYMKGSNSIRDMNSNGRILLNNSLFTTYPSSSTTFQVTSNINVFDLVSGKLNISDANINVVNSTQINSFALSDPSSIVSITGSTVSTNRVGSFIITAGNASLNNSNISMDLGSNYGISILDGGKLTLNSSTLGSSGAKLTIGIFDQGAASISGTGSTIYANSCGSGDSYSRTINLSLIDDSYDGVALEATQETENLNFNIRNYFNKLSINCL